jgi:bacterial/archaeal transporter family-2 protein
MLKYVVLAAASGFFLPLQALINARTSNTLGGTLWATLVNFAGGTVVLIAVLALLRSQVPTVEQAGRVPLYGWLSGLLGILFVAQAAFTVPKLGAAAMAGLVIAGQMFGSVVYDYFGVLQSSQQPGWQKIAGALLLIAGVWLILQRTE